MADTDSKSKAVTRIKSIAEAADILKPTHKSVQAIKSRLGISVVVLRSAGQKISTIPSSLRSWQARRHTSTLPQLDNKTVPANLSATASAKSQTTAGQTIKQPAASFLTRRADAVQVSMRSAKKILSASPRHIKKILNRLPRRQNTQKLDQSNQNFEDKSIASVPKTPRQKTAPVLSNVLHRRVSTRVISTVPEEIAISNSGSPPTQTRLVRKILPRHSKTVSTPISDAKEAISAHDYQRAEDILIPYIVKNTKDTGAYLLLGQMALERGDWEEAIEIFEQLVNWGLKPKGAYAGLGLAACRAGHFSQAIRALQKAHEEEPENVQILQNLLSIAKKMDNQALQHSIAVKLETLQETATAPSKTKV
ncbi:MAG: tetratricopeptide repeat protein [bacterium]|nr:tetratricopeptide repeat protein [bacterium]